MNHYEPSQRNTLLQLAAASIRHGLSTHHPLEIDLSAYDESLREARACFVTLELKDMLRGCIGSLQARRALLIDVSENAFAAAFSDPRFTPLRQEEYADLYVDISVLQPAVAMQVNDEGDLLDQLRPGIDGLILEGQGRRATFLPSVWEQLPGPREFLAHLKQKAGLPADYWSPELRFSRYTTESFGSDIRHLD